MLVHWVERSLTPPLEHTSNFVLTYLRLVFFWRLSLILSRRRLRKIAPYFCLSCRRERHPLSVHMRNRSSDLKSSLVNFDDYDNFDLVMQWLLSAFFYIFIYLFFQFPITLQRMNSHISAVIVSIVAMLSFSKDQKRLICHENKETKPKKLSLIYRVSQNRCNPLIW